MEDSFTADAYFSLKDAKKVGFLGFGRSCRALYTFLSERIGAQFVIRDEKRVLASAPRDVTLMLGDRCYEMADEDVIVLSPSVRRERREVSALLKSGARFSSDAEIFFGAGIKNVLAVSGSDGKSTTSALVGEILKKNGFSAHVCGNFGTPMTPLIENRDDFFVTELSSFMLRYVKPASRRAVITSLTPNHLNWHDSYSEYRDCKAAIYENADEPVFNADISEIPVSRAYAVFSAELCLGELKKKLSAENYFTCESGYLMKNGEKILDREKLALAGIHGVKNALAALAMTDGICDTGAAKEALSGFSGLSHRCELVGELHGMKFYDSSIDTTPERTRTTLLSLDGMLTVILGGRGKGLSPLPLIDALKKRAAAVILLGESSDEILRFLNTGGYIGEISVASDMRDAVKIALRLGHDTVLSPAYTSYDRYNNFEERGEDFSAAVKELIKRG